MTKRPEGGLLAGQWEFVHTKVDDSDKVPPFSRRKTLIRSRLLELFESPSTIASSNDALERRDLGELVHIFSHVKHHMGVEHLHFDAAPPPLSSAVSAASTVRWMTVDDMHALGITTGVKKILQLVLKSTSSSSGTATTRKSRRSAASVTTTTNTKDTKPKAQSATSKRRSATSSAAAVTDGKRLKTIQSFFKK
ncbi:hypothetical protein PINS_up009785 [Pythium insidiosum]|nr:hypothetical protein PINS_up009785 [Pythium insidiosum]